MEICLILLRIAAFEYDHAMLMGGIEMTRRQADTVRISATIPLHHEEALKRLADRDRISVAHVVRRAVEHAIAEVERGLLTHLKTAGTRPDPSPKHSDVA